ncbi:hypothetical protein JCM11251_000248 [Rhodosporidiobolus azoricus]
MAQLLGVPPPTAPPDPATPAPLYVLRSFRPYYSPLELDHLVALQSSTRLSSDEVATLTAAGEGAAAAIARKAMSEGRREAVRQLACGFIERVGGRLGFPRRTIATAQKLYHRFHLHFPLNEFAYQDVSLSTLLVASKLEDTLKKLRDIQIAAWQVANMMEGGDGRGEGESAAQEAHRPHLIAIERLILQTISFNFNLHRSPSSTSTSTSTPLDDLSSDTLLALATPPPTRDAFTYLLRLSASLPSLPLPLSFTLSSSSAQETLRKRLTHLAFLLLTDLHRTLAPLSYPPHTCAAACLWVGGVLLAEAEGGEGDVWDAEMRARWATEAESDEGDIDDIAQTLLNLLISLCPSPPASTNTSASSSALQQTSPSFSPSSLASPSEPSALSTSSSTPSGAVVPGSKPLLSERDRHLLAAGVPNAFTHTAALPDAEKGSRGFSSPDRLTGVKIRLRAERAASSSSSSLKRPADETPDAVAGGEAEAGQAELKRAKRWKSALTDGLADVARLRDEQLHRDLLRAQERAEREVEAAEAAAGVAVGARVGENGGEGMERSGSRAKTAEEREQERRERRERGRPGGVRYRF